LCPKLIYTFSAKIKSRNKVSIGLCAHIHACTHAYTHHTHAYTCTHIHRCTVHKQCQHYHQYVHACVCICHPTTSPTPLLARLYVYVCIFYYHAPVMHACMATYTYAHLSRRTIHVHICIYSSSRNCRFVCAYTRMHTCTHHTHSQMHRA